MSSAAYASTDLSASRHFESTADNSVAAKNRAVAEARRSLTAEIIRRNASDSAERVERALEGFTDADAQILVRSMSVENEKRSATTYAASITINLDQGALANWFDRNGLASSALNHNESAGWTQVHFGLSDGLNQWKWLNTRLRESGVQNRGGLQITKINGNQIFGKVPDSSARGFTNGLRAIGASVYNSNGTLRVSLPSDSTKAE
ncbi:MAG: hypothetical protein LBH81_03305 [Rickettsiales bacterium]|jgi:hypothetical protein|nr:hypothetical protein [Rickettsiales bacterium]